MPLLFIPILFIYFSAMERKNFIKKGKRKEKSNVRKPYNLEVDKPLFDKLKNHAERKNIGINGLVGRIIRRFLRKNDKSSD